MRILFPILGLAFVVACTEQADNNPTFRAVTPITGEMVYEFH